MCVALTVERNMAPYIEHGAVILSSHLPIESRHSLDGGARRSSQSPHHTTPPTPTPTLTPPPQQQQQQH